MAGLLDTLFGNADQTQALGLLGAHMMAGNTPAGFQSAMGLLAQAPDRDLKRKLAQVQFEQAQMGTDEMRRKLADDDATRKVLQGIYSSSGLPQSPMAGGMPQGPQLGAQPGGMSPPQGMPLMQQPGAQATSHAGGVTPKADVWQQYKMIGDKLASQGLVTQAQQYYGLAEKMRPKFGTEPRVMRDPATGQLVNVLVGEDGSTQVVPFGVKPDMKMQDLGGKVQAVDQNALTPGQMFNKTMTPGEIATNARAQQSHQLEVLKADPFGTLGINKNAAPGAQASAGLSGDAYLATLAPGIASQIKAIADGKVQISPYTLRTPQGQALLQMAMQYEPGTDQTTYTKRAATAKDAASGKLAQSNNALNTVAGHLAGLSEAADALNNTSVPVVNSAVNWIQSNLGDPRVKSFNMNVQGVANELERAYRGAGGSEADIKLWRDSLSSANSPEQFKGIFAKGAEMLQSKLEANQAQYDQGMSGRSGGYSAITPKAADSLAKLRGRGSSNAHAPAMTNAQGWVLHTDAQGNKAYVSPDGKQFQQVQ